MDARGRALKLQTARSRLDRVARLERRSRRSAAAGGARLPGGAAGRGGVGGGWSGSRVPWGWCRGARPARGGRAEGERGGGQRDRGEGRYDAVAETMRGFRGAAAAQLNAALAPPSRLGARQAGRRGRASCRGRRWRKRPVPRGTPAPPAAPRARPPRSDCHGEGGAHKTGRRRRRTGSAAKNGDDGRSTAATRRDGGRRRGDVPGESAASRMVQRDDGGLSRAFADRRRASRASRRDVHNW